MLTIPWDDDTTEEQQRPGQSADTCLKRPNEEGERFKESHEAHQAQEADELPMDSILQSKPTWPKTSINE